MTRKRVRLPTFLHFSANTCKINAMSEYGPDVKVRSWLRNEEKRLEQVREMAATAVEELTNFADLPTSRGGYREAMKRVVTLCDQLIGERPTDLEILKRTPAGQAA